MTDTPLRDGGRLLFAPAFLPPADADTLLAHLLANLPWQQDRIFGRPAPRLTAWIADVGIEYRYSGLAHVGTGWGFGLEAVRDAVWAASGCRFNSLLLNRYRDGNDSIGMHADDEPELGENPTVATLSLGAERTFVLRHAAAKETVKVRLPHGSLLVMAGTTQTHWRHGVPKTAEAVGERVSLTFRRIGPVPASRGPSGPR